MRRFAEHQFNIRKLMVDIVLMAALEPGAKTAMAAKP
jgi:hypothetical protein